MSPAVKNGIVAFTGMIVMAGVYGAVISFCNHYLRMHNLLNGTTKFLLSLSLILGFYFIYRWFVRRLKKIEKNQ